MIPPPPQRIAEVWLLLAEPWLARVDRDGGLIPLDVVWMLEHYALAAPSTAVRLRHVRAILRPEDRADVTRRAGDTKLADGPIHTAGSTLPGVPRTTPGNGDPGIGSRAAALMLGVENQSVRIAARRGTLPAVKGSDGRWTFDRRDVEEYGRRHGRLTAGDDRRG